MRRLRPGRELRLRRPLDRADHGLLGLGGAALGLLGALFGFGNALLHLLQPALALFLLCSQSLQSFRLDSTLLGRLGPLLDLAQALLRLGHRAFLGFALLLQPLLGAVQVGNRGQRRGRLRRQRRRDRSLGLEPRRLLDPAVGLDADPLLLETDLLDLVAHALFGGNRVVLGRSGGNRGGGRRGHRRHRRG